MTSARSAVAAYALGADDGERLGFGEVEVVVKASADTTGGAFTIFEENEPVDTRLHVHEHEDELFYVLEGEHVFQVGDQEFRAGPGGLVFAPRGVPHAQRRVVPRTGRSWSSPLPRDSRGSSGTLQRQTAPASSGPTATRARPRTTASPGWANPPASDFARGGQPCTTARNRPLLGTTRRRPPSR